MVLPAYPALCPLCVRLIYYATLWSGIPPLRRIMWFLIKCFQHSLLLGKLIIDPPCDYFELTSLTENYLLEHNIIMQPCCSVQPPSPHPPHPPGQWSLTVFALITPHTPSSWRQNSTGQKHDFSEATHRGYLINMQCFYLIWQQLMRISCGLPPPLD